MSLLDDLQPPGQPTAELDLTDPRVASLLADLPGNILKGHGRTFTRMRFVRFTDPVMGRKWAGELGQTITTAADLAEQAAKFTKGAKTDGGVFVGLYLTQSGLLKLGCAAFVPANTAFRAGQLSATNTVPGGRAGTQLRDKSADWTADRYLQELHALFVVAYNPDDPTADDTCAEADRLYQDWLSRPGIEFAGTPEERGGRLFDSGGVAGRRELEHFGFRDGVATLRFLPKTRPTQPDDIFPLRQALRELPSVPGQPAGTSRYGSFVVFRKLEQDVSTFRTGIARLASNLLGDATALGIERAYAWVVGRFRDGTPLALSDRPTNNPTDDFTFAGDEGSRADGGGRGCPFHAHIRKMNPRGDFDPMGQKMDPRARLPIRRSVPYGDRVLRDRAQRILAVDQPPPAGAKVGLLFFAFVSSIEDQFEHVVSAWANQSGFPWSRAPVDALLGRTKAGTVSVPGRPSSGPGNETGSLDLARCVLPRGGAYLFAPPPSFFRDLANGTIP